MAVSPDPPPWPTFGQALRFWLKLGLISFGGPAGQIAILHKELVETKRWVSERQFLNGLNYCLFLPGPEAQQLVTYLGWRLHGARGGIAAGSLFVIPSMFLLFALSWAFMAGGNLPWLGAVFHGLTGAVIAIVFEAVFRIAKRSLHSAALWVIAALSLAGIALGQVSFVVIVVGAGVVGGFGHRWLPRQFPAASGHRSGAPADEGASIPTCAEHPGGWRRAASVLTLTLGLWWAPVFALAAWLGWQSTPVQQGLFFSKASLVTFGGAYAVLPYVAQQAVEQHQWLSHSQMMAGLALAESTPGPLIMVLQFVGFVGGWQDPGTLPPLTSAILGSAITTWVTFLPSFLFIFLGAPFVEKISGFPTFSAALNGISAAVVGVILNLGVQFARHALWHPGQTSVDCLVAVLALASFAALKWGKAGIVPVIAACGLAGWLRHWSGGL